MAVRFVLQLADRQAARLPNAMNNRQVGDALAFAGVIPHAAAACANSVGRRRFAHRSGAATYIGDAQTLQLTDRAFEAPGGL